MLRKKHLLAGEVGALVSTVLAFFHGGCALVHLHANAVGLGGLGAVLYMHAILCAAFAAHVYMGPKRSV